MAMTIRPARAADADADAAALAAMFTARNRHEDSITQDRRSDALGGAETMRVTMARVRDTQGHGLIAAQDGVAVGFLLLEFRRDSIVIRPELRPHADVSDLFVAPSCRGQGIGAALMRAAGRLAIARGMPRIGVGVLVGNSLAEHLYARVGYSPYAMEPVKTLSSDVEQVPNEDGDAGTLSAAGVP